MNSTLLGGVNTQRVNKLHDQGIPAYIAGAIMAMAWSSTGGKTAWKEGYPGEWQVSTLNCPSLEMPSKTSWNLHYQKLWHSPYNRTGPSTLSHWKVLFQSTAEHKLPAISTTSQPLPQQWPKHFFQDIQCCSSSNWWSSCRTPPHRSKSHLDGWSTGLRRVPW